MKYDLVSFDVFDTLVTRRTATPKGIFSLMENGLRNLNVPKILSDNFLGLS